MSAVHLLASEYGWSKADILSGVYPDELELYVKEIRKDRIRQRLEGIETEMLPNLEVAERRSIIQGLYGRLRQLEGLLEETPKLDRHGLARLKDRMRGESKQILVK